MSQRFRIAIVGAASLRGKELNEELGESIFAGSEFLLMDDEEVLGQLETVGDEVTFIQQITPASFDRVDFTFFTSTPEVTLRHWQNAARAGSAIVDLSGALESEAGVVVCAPWITPEAADDATAAALDLRTPAVVPAQSAAVVLALILSRLQNAGAIRSAFATVLEPASEYGRAAMDELHQQTVSLLSFQNMPKEIYDTQVAFNATPVAGDEGKLNLGETERRIRRHYALVSAGKLPEVAIQLIHAPVFHGYTVSLGLEFERPLNTGQVIAVLTGEHVEMAHADADSPSNLAAAGQEEILVRLRNADDSDAPSTRFWLWMAADNLKLSALGAIACAGEMRRLRPLGTVQ